MSSLINVIDFSGSLEEDSLKKACWYSSQENTRENSLLHLHYQGVAVLEETK